MDKLAPMKIAPLVVNGQLIRFVQAEFTDAPALLAVILAAYIEYTCHPGFSQPTSVTMEKQVV